MSAPVFPTRLRKLEDLLAALPRRALLVLAQRALDAAARRPAVLDVTADTYQLARKVERLARKGARP